MGPAAIAMGAVAGISSIIKHKADKKRAKKAQKAADRQRKESLGFAGPENYSKNYGIYQDLFKNAYMPHLRSIGEALALGEQSGLQSFEADLTRRGMSGSGLAMAGRNSIRAGRQANYNQAARDFYNQWESAARGQADTTSGRQTSTSLGAPVTYIPAPTSAEGYANAVQSALSTASGMGSLMGYGTQSNPSWFSRPNSSVPAAPTVW